jgi:hypothetical protein
VVSHLHTASLGGHDVLGCNCTCRQLRARASDFFALAIQNCPTVLVSGFSDGGGGGSSIAGHRLPGFCGIQGGPLNRSVFQKFLL